MKRNVMGIPFMVEDMPEGYYIVEVLYPTGTRYYINIIDSNGAYIVNDIKESFARELWRIRLLRYHFSGKYNNHVTHIYKWG